LLSVKLWRWKNPEFEKQHAQGKLIARERIDYLMDKGEENAIMKLHAFVVMDVMSAHGECRLVAWS